MSGVRIPSGVLLYYHWWRTTAHPQCIMQPASDHRGGLFVVQIRTENREAAEPFTMDGQALCFTGSTITHVVTLVQGCQTRWPSAAFVAPGSIRPNTLIHIWTLRESAELHLDIRTFVLYSASRDDSPERILQIYRKCYPQYPNWDIGDNRFLQLRNAVAHWLHSETSPMYHVPSWVFQEPGHGLQAAYSGDGSRQN